MIVDTKLLSIKGIPLTDELFKRKSKNCILRVK